MSTSPAQFHIGGAEVLMRISPAQFTQAGGEVIAEAGPWLADPVAGVSRGSLAVALDDVTGYVIAAGVPADRWPVSLGIRVDFLADPPTHGGHLSAVGELVARDDRGGTTRGVVTDESGTTVALMTQRSHLVTAASAAFTPDSVHDLAAPELSVREQLGIVDSAPGVITLPPTLLAANGMGSIHGGILVCVSELAAMSALGAQGELRTTSVDIAYVRPCNAADTTTFTSEVLHRGRSLSVVRVVAANSSGKPSSIATVIIQG